MQICAIEMSILIVLQDLQLNRLMLMFQISQLSESSDHQNRLSRLVSQIECCLVELKNRIDCILIEEDTFSRDLKS
jgi:hypothetical protein